MRKRNIVNNSLLLLALSLVFSAPLEAQTMKNDNDLQKRVRGRKSTGRSWSSG